MKNYSIYVLGLLIIAVSGNVYGFGYRITNGTPFEARVSIITVKNTFIQTIPANSSVVINCDKINGMSAEIKQTYLAKSKDGNALDPAKRSDHTSSPIIALARDSNVHDSDAANFYIAGPLYGIDAGAADGLRTPYYVITTNDWET